MRSINKSNMLIGQGLREIGAIKIKQINEILKRQKNGDNRLFGKIALDLGYIDLDAVISYLDSPNRN